MSTSCEKQVTILYADDDDVSRRVMKFLLTHLGYTLILAVNGRDALEKYHTNRQEIGLLLLDVMMPDLNGLEVLHLIRSFDPGVKALFCTSAPETVHYALGDQDEAVEIIVKPVGLEKLADTLWRAIG